MVRRTLVLTLSALALAFVGSPAPIRTPAPEVAIATPQATAASPAQPATAAAPQPPADVTPSRLLIPRIGVDAPIEARGLDGNRNLATPADVRDVAWFDQGPAPGQPGNALLNGHVTWTSGGAVFARLAELRAGDQVIVGRADGTRASFRVNGIRTLAASAREGSLFAASDVSTLTLITCSGLWDAQLASYTHRLLVSATLG